MVWVNNYQVTTSSNSSHLLALMVIQDIHQIGLSELHRTFNKAFSDYVLPLHVTVKQLAENIRRDGIDFRFSAGAFEEGNLVGFILNSLEEWNGLKTAYNGGTGVIPDFRGQKLTRRMYAYLLPLLQQEGVQQCLLEVIAINQIAMRTYQAIGFEHNRSLNCYKANLKDLVELPAILHPGVQIREMAAPDWELVQQFWDYHPSWQYSIASVKRLSGKISFLGAFEQEELLGYAAVTPHANRIAQFAVSPQHRGRGIGRALFRQIARQAGGPLVVINVDQASTDTNQFLRDLGFTCFIKQIEMIRPMS
jgi:ribosomal protein S18 acetylase RimI-like enzyme